MKENDTKSYESYQMLAKLLNSERKENIDKAYDALRKALDDTYAQGAEKLSDEYEKKKNALAKNRAKAEKYLNYFMTEKGYDGSGIEADAKLKSQLSYASDMAALEAAEQSGLAELAAKRVSEESKNESDRAKLKEEADGALNYQLYKLKEDEDQTELKKLGYETEKYLKEKELEYKNAQAEAERQNDKDKLDAYRLVISKSVLDDFNSSDSVESMQSIYDSLTGVNSEKASEILGADYKSVVNEMSAKLNKAKAEDAKNKKLAKLYRTFEESADKEYHGQTYMRLKRAISLNEFPGYTVELLDEAYKTYLKDTGN